jgi:hypothetical protein
MAFKEDEINQLKLAITQANEPIVRKLIEHELTLHDEDVGVCKRLKDTESKVADLKSFKRQVIAVVATIQGVGIAIMEYIKLRN